MERSFQSPSIFYLLDDVDMGHEFHLVGLIMSSHQGGFKLFQPRLVGALDGVGLRTQIPPRGPVRSGHHGGHQML
jgi:hypothetical protein